MHSTTTMEKGSAEIYYCMTARGGDFYIIDVFLLYFTFLYSIRKRIGRAAFTTTGV